MAPGGGPALGRRPDTRRTPPPGRARARAHHLAGARSVRRHGRPPVGHAAVTPVHARRGTPAAARAGRTRPGTAGGPGRREPAAVAGARHGRCAHRFPHVGRGGPLPRRRAPGPGPRRAPAAGAPRPPRRPATCSAPPARPGWAAWWRSRTGPCGSPTTSSGPRWTARSTRGTDRRCTRSWPNAPTTPTPRPTTLPPGMRSLQPLLRNGPHRSVHRGTGPAPAPGRDGPRRRRPGRVAPGGGRGAGGRPSQRGRGAGRGRRPERHPNLRASAG